VLSISIATVIGPTPPGTGVERLLVLLTESYISPQSFPFESLLIPISIDIPPGFS